MHEPPYSGRFEAGEHLFGVRVYFEDTDAGGMVYHANYLRFMERARSDMMRLAGIHQRESFEAGEGAYVVAEIGIRYKRSALLDDDLLVISRIAKVGGASCAIHQRVMRGSELMAEADVAVVLIDRNGRPKRQPRQWVEAFKRYKGTE